MIRAENLVTYGPLVLIGLAAVWNLGRILWLRRSKGVSVLAAYKRRKTPTELGLGTLGGSMTLYLLMRPLLPALDTWLYTLPSLAPLVGLGVMALGVTGMAFAQANMGKAWRIGVPNAREDSQLLVAHGLHAYSRNPIYVGVMLYLIGTLLMLPGPFTLAVTVGTFLLLQKLIASEEAFMTEAFGEAYLAYMKRVRRWV